MPIVFRGQNDGDLISFFSPPESVVFRANVSRNKEAVTP